MIRLVLWIAAGLMGALIVHLVLVLATPSLVPVTLAERILRLQGEASGFFALPHALDEDRGMAYPGADPFMLESACRLALDGDAPMVVRGRIDAPMWSLAVFSRDSMVVSSLNDRISPTGDIDLIIGTAKHQDLVNRGLVALGDETIFLETGDSGGYVVLRALIPDATYLKRARASLEAAACVSATLLQPDTAPDGTDEDNTIPAPVPRPDDD